MRRLLFACLLLCSVAASAAPHTITLATWNLQWLVSAQSLANLRQRCLVPQRPNSLACDVPERFARNSADFARLARYARALDADVIALQEVESAGVAAEVFPRHHFCFTARRDLQNVGFAIRRGITHRCGADLVDLSLRDSVRRGAELTLFPGSAQETRLLAVHLKSGCPRRPLDSHDPACTTLRRQIAPLESWIDAQAAAGRRFAVLGDFNRDLLREDGGGFWRALDDAEPPLLRLHVVAAGQAFRNCVIGQTFTGFIDHIVLGGALVDALQPDSFRHLGYEAMDARRYKLSDHCPVAITLRLSP